MAYDQEDVVRSIRRYVTLMLGQPWNVALERQEVRDDMRPMGLVEAGAERERRARLSVPQGERENFMPVTVALYPALAEPRAAGRDARQLAGRLRNLVQVGAYPAGEASLFRANGRPAVGPERMPLWDYAATAPGTAGPALPHDVLWAEDWSVDAVQDPTDARRWTVILEMRVSYEAPGAKQPDAPVVVELLGAPDLPFPR